MQFLAEVGIHFTCVLGFEAADQSLKAALAFVAMQQSCDIVVILHSYLLFLTTS
jgi:hypothetical protein